MSMIRSPASNPAPGPPPPSSAFVGSGIDRQATATGRTDPGHWPPPDWSRRFGRMTDQLSGEFSSAAPLPSYAELRARTDGAPPGTAWGVFGDEDEVGTINLLDAQRVLAGVREVRLGEVHALNWNAV